MCNLVSREKQLISGLICQGLRAWGGECNVALFFRGLAYKAASFFSSFFIFCFVVAQADAIFSG